MIFLTVRIVLPQFPSNSNEQQLTFTQREGISHQLDRIEERVESLTEEKENGQKLSCILDVCKKKKNRLAETRQKDPFTSQSTMMKYRQKRIRKITSPLIYKHSRQIMLKIFPKRQNTKKKEKSDQSLGNQAQTNIQLRIPLRSQHHSYISCSSTAGKPEDFTLSRHLTAHPTSHRCHFCTTTSICTTTD